MVPSAPCSTRQASVKLWMMKNPRPPSALGSGSTAGGGAAVQPVRGLVTATVAYAPSTASPTVITSEPGVRRAGRWPRSGPDGL